MEKNSIYNTLKQAKKHRLITNQQYKTLKGQVINGDEKGAKLGLRTLIKRKNKKTGQTA